jgi:hypothetical protein
MDQQSPSPAPSSHSDPYDEELDLTRYAALLWRRRWAIAMSVLVCGAMGWLIPVTHVATALLKSPHPGPVAAQVAAEALDLHLVRVQDSSLSAHVVSELALDRPPYNMTLSQVQAALTFRVGSPENVMLVEVRMRDPELAARVADSAARRAVEVDQQEFDESKRAVEEMTGALFQFDRVTMPPLLEGIERLQNQRRQLWTIQADIESASALLLLAKQQRFTMPPLLVLEGIERLQNQRRQLWTIQDDIESASALLLLAKQQGVRLPDDCVRSLVECEERARQSSRAVLSAQQELASLEARRSHLEKAQKSRTSQQTELFRSERERDQLEAVLRRAEARHQLADARRIQAPDATALAAVRPLSSPTPRNVAVGLAIGLFLSVTTMLLYDGLSAGRVKWAEAEPIETSDQG